MGDHYVPRFYLKGFEQPDRPGVLWVFRNGQSPFQTSINNIAHQTNFYSREVEKLLANKVEQPANDVIRKIRAQKSITQEERVIMAKYMITMWKRVPEHKKWSQERTQEITIPIIDDLIRDLLEKRQIRPDKADIIDRRIQEAEKIKSDQQKLSELAHNMWLDNIYPDTTPQAIDVLLQMTWCFMVSDQRWFFVTSDNPLFFFRSIGIGKPNSEVSFPLNNHITLWASWRTDIRSEYIPIGQQEVKEINRRTISASTTTIFSAVNDEWIQRLLRKPKDRIKLNRIV